MEKVDFRSSLLAEEIEAVLTSALTYKTPQKLTESEKAFVRAKIGATELGKGIIITSHFDSLEELEAAVPNPKAGDAYSIGTELPYNLYVYDFAHATWVSHGAIRANDIAARFAQNKAVTVDAWEEDTEVFADYTYKAAIPLAEITGNAFPIVAFAPADAAGGSFCPICFAFDGYVEIWANAIPTADIVIPAITFIVEDTQDGENGNSTKGITNATGAFPEGGLGTNSLANGAVTREKLATDVKNLAFTDVLIPDYAWQENSSLENYPYSALVELPNSGIDSSFFPDVVFDENDADLAPVAESAEGGVLVFAAEPPEEIIKIKSLICTPTKAITPESRVFGIIAVTYAAGKTVTCTDGTRTLTAKTTSGFWQFAVPYAGEWIISDGINSQIVSITTQGQIEVAELNLEGAWLYNKGNEFIDITGGWVNKAFTSGNYTSGTLTKNQTSISLTTSANDERNNITATTANKVSLTEAEKLVINIIARSGVASSSLGGAWLVITDAQDGNNTGASVLKSIPITEVGQVELEISDISGEHYVAVICYGASLEFEAVGLK